MLWDVSDNAFHSRDIAISRGKALIGVVETYRSWNSMHGAVYLPVAGTEPSPPASDAKIPGTVSTVEGLDLYALNHVEMTRHVGRLSSERRGISFRLTSLRPVNSENTPDEWEAARLRDFENGATEALALVEAGNQKYYRYISPIYVRRACLGCHEKQGYKDGDVRGGISVTFPAMKMLRLHDNHLFHSVLIHLGALLIGGLGIMWAARLSARGDRRIREERDRLQALVALTGATHWEVELNTFTYTYMSQQVEALLGYPAHEWTGLEFWASRLHPDDRQWVTRASADLAAKGEDHVMTYRMVAASGKEIWVRDIVNVDKDEAGRPLKLRGLFIDDTELKKAESKLRLSIEEKEVLLREVHHRVKNNMMVITSLQSLQATRMEDSAAKMAIEENMKRIRSMALVYEKICQSDDLASMDINDYIGSLLMSLCQEFKFPRDNIQTQVHVPPRRQDLDMLIPIGLIINELVSNAMKHAFADGQPGEIVISLDCSDKDDIELVVTDNGKGLPGDITLEGSKTLGILLVKALVDQLQGNAELIVNGGTTFRLTFAKKTRAKNSL